MLRRVIDPCYTELLSIPKDVAELAQSALHGWLLALDNISKLSTWASDAICRIITGDGFEKRKLFSDEEDVLWSFRRVVVVNGIGAFATRPDLLDRAIKIELEPFGEGQRIPEEVLFKRFDADLPLILGAVFDTLAEVLRILPEVEPPDGIRMMDAAAIGVAVEKACGWPEGAFVEAMRGNAEAKLEDAVEDSLVAQAILRLGENLDTMEWRGTSTALLAELKKTMEEESTFSKSWPRSAASLSNELKRLGPVLRHLGVTVDEGRTGHASTREKVIQWNTASAIRSSALSASSAQPDIAPNSYHSVYEERLEDEVGTSISPSADDADDPSAGADDALQSVAWPAKSQSDASPPDQLSEEESELLDQELSELFPEPDDESEPAS